MREWSLTAKDPLTLRIAADARLTVPSYVNDQIWELSLEGGQPAALALETSYGLRARSMRIFPGFRLDRDVLLDPVEFHSPPEVRSYLPNFLRVIFSPAEDFQVVSEYWVPESNLIGGRLTLYNAGTEPLQVELHLHAMLQPGDQPHPMSSVSQQGATVLVGSTESLTPLLYLSGGPIAAIGPYPALMLSARLMPGDMETTLWAHAGGAKLLDSFTLARELMACNWDAEIARIEQANSGLLEVETGNREWDAALAMTQISSLAAFVGPTEALPHASIVQERSQTRGFSAHPAGRDHDEGWSGQAVTDALVTLPQILHVAPELAKGVMLNFLATQSRDGSIDLKPGLGSQRSGLLSPPLLATLAWRIYSHTDDQRFLEEAYPGLLRFVEVWFQERHDRDQDNHPEWDNTLQTGFVDWPAFVRWRKWGQGLTISLAETPDLAAFLFKETAALIEIGRVLGQAEQHEALLARLEALRKSTERSWSDQSNCYLSLDRDLNQTVSGSRLGTGQGNFQLEVGEDFEPAVRVLVRVRGEEREKRELKVVIRGRVPRSRKRVHQLGGKDFQWFDELGTATTDSSFIRLEKIAIRGLNQDSKTELRTADFSRPDHTGLLPLWAGVPEGKRADQMLKGALTKQDRFWRTFGIPNWPADGLAYRHARVEIRPNLMIGEGLVDYGYLEEAADLVGRLMEACTWSLREERAFCESYYPDEPRGSGTLGHTSGVAPLSLFLYVLGVRLISPHKIALRGHNPFKRAIRLRHRGLEVVWEAGGARIRFPDGAEIVVTGREVQIVEQADR